MSRRIIYWILGIFGFVSIVILVWWIGGKEVENEYSEVPDDFPLHYSGKAYAGSASCVACHEDISAAHSKTAHQNTSRPGEKVFLLGNFDASSEPLKLQGGQVNMVSEVDNFYQEKLNYISRESDRSKIDIVLGSGVKGQSHLSFHGDSLYQLPASYFTLTEDWINSPGFPNYPYERPVSDECLKCHVTFAKNKDVSGKSNIYPERQIILGVSCESCHGPSQGHIDFHTETNSIGRDPMIKIGNLDRNLQVDVCAKCHSGLRAQQIKDNPFSFLAGEKLDDYSKNYASHTSNATLDVHGNQVGLLKQSACFENSDSMTCTTCHDSHTGQRGKTDYFNSKCLECHQNYAEVHTDSLDDTMRKVTDCTSCHMPLFPSNTMRFKSEALDGEISVSVRTHLIKVYRDEILRSRP